MSQSFILRNATVVSMDPALGTMNNTDVLIQDHIIKAVGKNLDINAHADFNTDHTALENIKTIDCTDAIVSPGFVDTHRHTWQTQLRTVVSDFVLSDYMAKIRRTYGSCYTARDVYLGNYCGALEGIEAGITFLLDHAHVMNSPTHADAAVQGLLDAKVRGVFCYCLYENPIHKGTLDGEAKPAGSPDWRFEDCKRLRREFFPDNAPTDLLRFGFAPTEIEFVPFEQSVKEVRFARSIGASIITGHVGLGKYSGERRLIRELDAEGLLGPDLVLSHCSTIQDDEIASLKKAGASVSTTPDTELQMDIGMPIAFKAHRQGCTASLGIDLTSNNPADMFQQMRLMLQTQRNLDSETEVSLLTTVSARCEDVLRLATMGGAEAVGLKNVIGSITPGKRADILITRCDSFRLVPVFDPVAALVLYANAADVDTVFVDGVPLKEGGKLVGVDWPRVRKELRDSASAIMERSEGISSG